MKHFLRNIELYLTFAGLMVILLAGVISYRTDADIWKVTAIAATLVGVLHGLIFWAVRRRQRRVRHTAIAAVKSMLKDLVNNQLAVMRLANDLNQNAPGSVDPAKIDRSIVQIKETVESLSDESLIRWQERYRRS